LDPACLLAHLIDRHINLAVDDVVDIAAPPLIADLRLVVEADQPGLKAPARHRLDGGPETLLIPGLAGFVFGPRHEGRCGEPRDGGGAVPERKGENLPTNV